MSIGCHINDDSFKLHGQTVQSVNTVRDLGVQFCSNVTFTSYINNIAGVLLLRQGLSNFNPQMIPLEGRYHHNKGFYYLRAPHLLYGRHITYASTQN